MLFKGTFNWYCELHTLYTHTKNESEAFSNFVTQLCTLLKRNRRSVYLNFVDKKGKKYDIKEVKQFVKEAKM